jgi:hypothetical protein
MFAPFHHNGEWFTFVPEMLTTTLNDKENIPAISVDDVIADLLGE